MLLNESLIISYSTPNYDPVTEIFLSSLKKLNVKEENIEHKLENLDHLANSTGFRTPIWYLCILNKVKHVVDILKKYENVKRHCYFVFSDCDIWFIEKNQHEWNHLKHLIDSSNKELFFMREEGKHEVNSGFYIIKNNDNLPNVIRYFENVVNIMQNNKENYRGEDQVVINSTLHKMNWGFIPNDYVVWGNNIYNRNKTLFHHAVCCRDVNDKVNQINRIKSMFN